MLETGEKGLLVLKRQKLAALLPVLASWKIEKESNGHKSSWEGFSDHV